MKSARRKWLKQLSLGIASFAISPRELAAAEIFDHQYVDGDKLPIRLSSNENPYGPSPLAKMAMRDHYAGSNRYGWDLTAQLIEKIAAKHGLPQDNILLGAGSTELLDLTARYAAMKPGNFIIADPTYHYWTATPVKLGLNKITVPLTADKKHDLAAMLKAINAETRLVYICNPNNPTGTVCDENELLQFIGEATKKTLVLVDEAYINFTTQQSLSGLTATNKNLVIAKTFSKIYGLAGARVGYAIAHPGTIAQMEGLQSWNNGSVSLVSVAAALASLKDEQFVRETYIKNENVRAYTLGELSRMGLRCVTSSTNFIYFSLEEYKRDYFQQLKDANIFGTAIYEEKGKWTRITVGTTEEMKKFITVIA